MTARSTRNKMRFQAEKIGKDLYRIEGHLKMIDDYSLGESEYINKHMPDLVHAVEMFKTIFSTFRAGL